MSNRKRHMALLAVAFALLGFPGCSLLHRTHGDVPVGLIAVVPIELDPVRAGATPVAGADAPDPLPADAGLAITGQIYGVFANRSDFRLVPDLTATQAMQSSAVRQAPDRLARAIALGKAVKADDVLFGSVSRFRERVGTEAGARQPAAVSFELQLVNVATGSVVWSGRFDETQQPLSSNLLNFWMFWRAGPHWFSARELANLGVGKLIDDLRATAK